MHRWSDWGVRVSHANKRRDRRCWQAVTLKEKNGVLLVTHSQFITCTEPRTVPYRYGGQARLGQGSLPLPLDLRTDGGLLDLHTR
jgi:hypothetical protein